MKNILLIGTGGTISCIDGKNGLEPGLTANEILGKSKTDTDNYRIESVQLMNIDSVNMKPEHWQKVASFIYENYSKYDGFVITHGTDTMAYTSAALSYMLQRLSKPIVLTGSQRPVNHPNTDAKKNLMDALCFSLEGQGGVYVVFDGKVIIGTRAVKVRTKSNNAFESINYPYFASIENEKVVYMNNNGADKQEELIFESKMCTNVGLVKVYPGMSVDLIKDQLSLYKGIIIETYGTGGVPSSLKSILDKNSEELSHNISVVIKSQCLEEGVELGTYEVSNFPFKDKVIQAKDMNIEALLPKLMWAIAQGRNPSRVKEIIETPINNDIG